jgi:hypothetical protein
MQHLHWWMGNSITLPNPAGGLSQACPILGTAWHAGYTLAKLSYRERDALNPDIFPYIYHHNGITLVLMHRLIHSFNATSCLHAWVNMYKVNEKTNESRYEWKRSTAEFLWHLFSPSKISLALNKLPKALGTWVLQRLIIWFWTQMRPRKTITTR